MAEQSHRDEMNAAIRAQRARHAVPRTFVPAEERVRPSMPAEAPSAEREPQRRGLLARIRGR
jgi:hypothetical protein